MMRRKLRRVLLLAASSAYAAWDIARYPLRRELGKKTWELLLELHCKTNGRSTAIVRRLVRRFLPPPAPIRPFDSMFGQFDSASIGAMAEQIRREGYYVFPGTIPASVCDEIADGVRSFEGWAWRDHNGMPHSVAKFDPDHLAARRYELPEPRIWQIPAYQRIIADPIFINLSQAYFKAASALKEAGLWWSPAIDNDMSDDDAAQRFHFDYDAAPIWLKFFIYLNDITAKTGPHVFVKGSHQLGSEKSRKLLLRGYVRVSDEEIAAVYGQENVIEMAGVKGTVFAVDTMGFHKGKVPVNGHRLLAQLEFATPLFVAASSRPLPMPLNADPMLVATRNAYPWAFARFPART